jgi:hypothetical protein
LLCRAASVEEIQRRKGGAGGDSLERARTFDFKKDPVSLGHLGQRNIETRLQRLPYVSNAQLNAFFRA